MALPPTSSSVDDAVGDLNELNLGTDFHDADPLTYDHVLAILNTIKKTNDPTEEKKRVFEQSYDYVSKFASFKNYASTESVRSKLKDLNFDPIEQVQLINLHPESVEEARSLIPSLVRDHEEEEIQEALQQIAMYQKTA